MESLASEIFTNRCDEIKAIHASIFKILAICLKAIGRNSPIFNSIDSNTTIYIFNEFIRYSLTSNIKEFLEIPNLIGVSCHYILDDKNTFHGDGTFGIIWIVVFSNGMVFSLKLSLIDGIIDHYFGANRLHTNLFNVGRFELKNIRIEVDEKAERYEITNATHQNRDSVYEYLNFYLLETLDILKSYNRCYSDNYRNEKENEDHWTVPETPDKNKVEIKKEPNREFSQKMEKPFNDFIGLSVSKRPRVRSILASNPKRARVPS